MKIVSNFKDYYDGCSYMCGEDTFYERTYGNYTREQPKAGKYISEHPKQPENNEALQSVFQKYLGKQHHRLDEPFKCVVIVGDRIIPFVSYKTISREIIYGQYFTKKIYSYDNVFNKEDLRYDLHGFQYRNMVDFFNTDLTDLKNTVRELSDAPIVMFSNINTGDISEVERSNFLVSSGAVENPCLKDIQGFSKTFEAHEIIQEIEMWLNRDKTVESKFTNDEKIQQAGFDLKTSFRG